MSTVNASRGTQKMTKYYAGYSRIVGTKDLLFPVSISFRRFLSRSHAIKLDNGEKAS